MQTIGCCTTFKCLIFAMLFSNVFTWKRFAPSVDQTLPRWPSEEELNQRAKLVQLWNRRIQVQQHLTRLRKANELRRRLKSGKPKIIKNFKQKQHLGEEKSSDGDGTFHYPYFAARSTASGNIREYQYNHKNQKLYDRLNQSKQRKGRGRRLELR